jgi:2-keto-4-pentenoate hydratase/2-oxohepta-3-ene-1,7-dioic acid hydratase in catechol pathway
MKVARFLMDGHALYGVVEEDGLYPCEGNPFDGLTKGQKVIPIDSVKLLAPVLPPNIIALGLNYRAHADESHGRYPTEPLMFLKATTSLTNPGDPILLPLDYPDSIDYESELAIVIAKRARHISEDEAPSVILGYTIANDVSNRAVQFKDGQWARGKSYDTFCPLGPWIVAGIDGDNLDISCRVNGHEMQASNTSDMIFSCRQIVAHLSRCMTLLPGTVILTGTPSGVGFVRKPPVFLKTGQTVECIIEGIGVLSNPVISPEAHH